MIGNEEKKSILDSIRNSVIKENEVEKLEEPKVEEEKISISKKKRKNRNRNRNRNKKPVSNNPIVEVQKLTDMSPEILAFKEKYTEDLKNREFLEFRDKSELLGDEVFSETDFLETRMKHTTSRVVILEPSIDDLILKKGQKWFLLKSVYTKEYMEFVKEFGPRETKPKEFMEFALKKCVLLPKFEENEVLSLPAGTLLTLYRTILDISDFNKMYKIVEV